MRLYTISGLGANDKVFERLLLPKQFEHIHIPWLIPEKTEKIEHYAKRMAEKINPNEAFVLMGLSFGGIIAQEIQQFLPAEKLILLSTIKSQKEKPKYIKFGQKTNAHKFLPIKLLTSDKMVSYAFFRKLYDPKLPELQKYFVHKEPFYLSWSIDQITRWQGVHDLPKNYIHLHGNNDIVFPSKNISNCKKIEGGTHLMVMQKPKIISERINSFLV